MYVCVVHTSEIPIVLCTTYSDTHAVIVVSFTLGAESSIFPNQYRRCPFVFSQNERKITIERCRRLVLFFNSLLSFGGVRRIAQHQQQAGAEYEGRRRNQINIVSESRRKSSFDSLISIAIVTKRSLSEPPTIYAAVQHIYMPNHP